VTACVMRPEFACYAGVPCERQTSGECGFTVTSTVQACLERVNASPSPSPSFSRADFNQDGEVNDADFQILRADFIKNEPGLVTDLNQDGRVNLHDYTVFIKEMQTQRPTN
jgi:hypothetical protein